MLIFFGPSVHKNCTCVGSAGGSTVAAAVTLSASVPLPRLWVLRPQSRSYIMRTPSQQSGCGVISPRTTRPVCTLRSGGRPHQVSTTCTYMPPWRALLVPFIPPPGRQSQPETPRHVDPLDSHADANGLAAETQQRGLAQQHALAYRV